MIAETERVLLFIESGGPGGAESVVLRLAGALRECGIDTAVMTARTGWLTDALRERGIEHVKIDAGGRFSLGFPLRIARVLRERRIDILHSHLLDSNFYAALGARIAGVRHIATEHGDVHHTQRKKFLRTKIRTISAMGSHFTAVSDFTALHLERLGAPRSCVTCVGNPVDAAPAIDASERKERRRSLGIEGAADDHWLWIHVANHRPVKDQATLLRGFAHALAHTPIPQTLCLVGDGPERANLETLRDELGVRERVHFAGFRDDVPRWLQSADGFVLSSRSEAMPMSLLEAALAGCLPVCTNVGGIGEVVASGQTGWLVDPGDPTALGNAMLGAVTDVAESRRLAAASRARVEAVFSVDAVLDAYLRIYRR